MAPPIGTTPCRLTFPRSCLSSMGLPSTHEPTESMLARLSSFRLSEMACRHEILVGNDRYDHVLHHAKVASKEHTVGLPWTRGSRAGLTPSLWHSPCRRQW